jgi:ankyrin repeat protein
MTTLEYRRGNAGRAGGVVCDSLWHEGNKMKKRIGFVFLAFLSSLASVCAQTQKTAFIELVKDGTPQDVRAAINKGADVNTRGSCSTPLMEAAGANSNPEVITVLLKAGADIEARDSCFGRTSLMWAALSNQNPEVLATLLKAGADLEARDNDGRTVLMWAARNNQPKVITMLLEAGADLNARSKNDMTALIWAAVYSQKPEVIMALLDAGADAKVKSKRGYAALDYAENNESLEGTDAYLQLQKASQ